MKDDSPSAAIEQNAPRFQFTLQQAFYWMTAAAILVWLASFGKDCFCIVIVFCPITLILFGILWKRIRVIEIAIVLQSFALIIGFLFSAVGNARTPDPTNLCRNNLKHLALGILNYHDSNLHIPIVNRVDAEGKATLSWRVEILPYIEQQPLYDQFALNEPWNSATNSLLIPQRSYSYLCPKEDPRFHTTSYLAITGKNTCWSNSKKLTFADVKDGLSNTMLMVERHNSGIIWSEPRDTDEQNIFPAEIPKSKPSIAADGSKKVARNPKDFNHQSGTCVLMADGSVRKLPNDIDPLVLQEMVNRSDRKWPSP